MLNGKFYTGLPEKMMNRGPNGIDRQRTNMYWPDEEGSPSIYEYSPSRNLRGPSSRQSSRASSISYDSQNSFNDDVNTREMVRKQQESKIQFYDFDDSHVPPSKTITPSSVARNLSRESPEADLSNRKLETLKSRIEFYDFVDEGAPQQPVRRNSRTSGQSPRESETRSPEAATTAAVNKSRDSNFIRGTYAQEDRTDGRAKTATSTTTVKSTRSTVNHDTDDDSAAQQSRRIPIERDTKVQVPKVKEQKVSLAKKQLSSSVIDLSTLDLDDPELEELKKLRPPSKNDINKKLATFETEIRTTNARSDSYNAPPRTRGPTEDPARARSKQVNGMRTASADDRRDGRNRDPITDRGDPEPPNEARRMAHRHLESSFSFGGAQPESRFSGGRRPSSIRDSAVCRVGVGLPDL